MSTWSIFDPITGILTGQTFSGPHYCLSDNTPRGLAAVEGYHDHTRVRVDIASGELVPYQPPAPDDDEWQTWGWDAEAWRWVSLPTTAALARDARAERDRRMQACDWTDTASAPVRLGATLYGAWQAHRQSLRDITSAAGFPKTFDWPEPPA